MATFLLVHGAWHGAWAWGRVAPLLTARGGHHVGTPELSARPDVGLREHAEEVVAAIDAVPPDSEVVLVGHSYAGLVVRQAADARAGRVSRVVLVDGWAGGDGAGLIDLAPPWFGAAVTGAARDGLVPPPGPDAFGITDPADADWLEERLRPHPLRTFVEPARLTGAVDRIPGLGICCRPEQLPFAALAAGVGYATVPVDGPHDVMLSHPERLADLLLRLEHHLAADGAGAPRGGHV